MRGVDIGEVAPPAPGNQDLPARLVRVIEQGHAAAVLPGGGRAHQPAAPAPSTIAS
jgi:hypothetical protein